MNNFSYSQPHRDECLAVNEVEKGTWDAPWTVSDVEYEFLDEEEEIEYEDGSIETQVIIFRCNDPDCPGKVAVPEKKILELLPTKPENHGVHRDV